MCRNIFETRRISVGRKFSDTQPQLKLYTNLRIVADADKTRQDQTEEKHNHLGGGGSNEWYGDPAPNLRLGPLWSHLSFGHRDKIDLITVL